MFARIAMGMAMIRDSTLAIAAGALAVFATPQASAQSLAKNERVRLEVLASDKLTVRQTVKLAPADILASLHTALTGAAINVVAAAEDGRLIVSIARYDSGPYLGFAKTARMTLDYELRRAAVAEPVRWTDSCEGRAAVDMRSSQERNKTAVQMCLASLGNNLAAALSGEADQIIVN